MPGAFPCAKSIKTSKQSFKSPNMVQTEERESNIWSDCRTKREDFMQPGFCCFCSCGASANIFTHLRQDAKAAGYTLPLLRKVFSGKVTLVWNCQRFYLFFAHESKYELSNARVHSQFYRFLLILSGDKVSLYIVFHRFTFATGASQLLFIVHFPVIYAVCPHWSAGPVKPRWSSNGHIDHGNPWWNGPTLRANEQTLYAPLPNQKSISPVPSAPNQSKVHLLCFLIVRTHC